MSQLFTMKPQNLPQVLGALSQIANLNPMLGQAVGAAAGRVAGTAQALAPVRTGYLRGTINAMVEGSRALVTVGAYYGKYQEFGTRKMRAQPFLSPAMRMESSNMQLTVRERIQAHINDACSGV